MVISGNYNEAGSQPPSDETGALEYLTHFLSNPEYDDYVQGEPEALASWLLHEFGTLGRIISEPEFLITRGRLPQNIADDISDLYDRYCQSLQENLMGQRYDPNNQALEEYLIGRFSVMPVERLGFLYLDKSGTILGIDDETAGTVGTVRTLWSHVALKAGAFDADSIVMLHNHPSGDPDPSPKEEMRTRYKQDPNGHYRRMEYNENGVKFTDVQMKFRDVGTTERVKDTLNSVGILLHDHLIVGRDETYSFREGEHSACVNADHEFETSNNEQPQPESSKFPDLQDVLKAEDDQGVTAPRAPSVFEFTLLFEGLDPNDTGSVIFCDTDNNIIHKEQCNMDPDAIADRYKELRASTVLVTEPQVRNGLNDEFKETDIQKALEQRGVHVSGVVESPEYCPNQSSELTT